MTDELTIEGKKFGREEWEQADNNARWGFIILSDVQELLSMGRIAEAHVMINQAKRALQGKYKTDGFFVEIERTERAKQMDNNILEAYKVKA